MKLFVFPVFALVVFNDLYADGFTDITATLSNGDIIIFIKEPPEYVIVRRPLGETGKLESFDYKNENCKYKHDEINQKPHFEFSCPANGKSPLAGTKYIGKYTLGDCEKGPMVIYTCVSGCKKNTPKKMTQTLWECGD